MQMDVLPFQAMEIAASSPRDLPRFLAGLDDAAVEQVRHIAELVLRATQTAQDSRRFTALWMEAGRREPAWPSDTSTLLADTVAAAVEGMTSMTSLLPPSYVAPTPDPLPVDTADLAAEGLDESAVETTAVFPAATDTPDGTSIPNSEDTLP